jgi:hypothetical protein
MTGSGWPGKRMSSHWGDLLRLGLNPGWPPTLRIRKSWGWGVAPSRVARVNPGRVDLVELDEAEVMELRRRDKGNV